MRERELEVGGEEIEVRVADSVLSKARGMMFRSWEGLDGMLFVFSGSRRWRVWTPFCPEMDILFLDEEMGVREKIEAEPWGIYRPEEPCRYVLELPPGSAEDVAPESG